jgi:hypothetical protein
MSPLGRQTPIVTIPQDEFEEMLSRAAERGALRAQPGKLLFVY